MLFKRGSNYSKTFAIMSRYCTARFGVEKED
jgi:hypothetical protein